MKFAITRNIVGANTVNDLLSDVLRFSVQYQNLTPSEKIEFDRKLASLTFVDKPKTQSQQANLGGNIENIEDLPDGILKDWKTPKLKPECVWLNQRE